MWVCVNICGITIYYAQYKNNGVQYLSYVENIHKITIVYEEKGNLR